MPTPKDRKYTADEFFELKNESDERYELIHGEIVALATPTEIHRRIVGEVHFQLLGYIKRKGGSCVPFVSPFAVKLDDENVVEPDVFVVCDPDKRDGKRVNGAPDLVVEVVSTNRSDDFVRKLGLYKDFGVKEYWIVDPPHERTLVYYFVESNSPSIYTFDQPIPVSIYGGEPTITIGDMI